MGALQKFQAAVFQPGHLGPIILQTLRCSGVSIGKRSSIEIMTRPDGTIQLSAPGIWNTMSSVAEIMYF